jgi:dipeptide/tripeptide permease
MRSATRALGACLVMAGLLALASGVAQAQGGGNNSAGNSQYVDPLSANGHSKHGSHSSGSSGSTTTTTVTTTTTTTATGSSTLSPSAPSSVSGSGTPSRSSSADSGKTLPYTGLNLGACVALGLGLLAGGLALRRALARAY